MEVVDFFLEQHGRSHAASMTGATEPMAEDQLVAGLTEGQLRRRPHPGLNSIAWLLWHIARSEDVVVHVLLAGGRQVLDDGWRERLRLAQSAMGTEMGDEEVTAVSDQLDIPALRAYRVAVGQRTQDVVRGLRVDAWDEPIEPDRLLVVGAFADAADGARRIATYWHGRPKRFVFTSSITTHSYLHLGEAACIKTFLQERVAER